MTRILDLRIILDRDGRTRVSVDGRELVRAGSTADALTFIASRLERRPPSEQLSALRSAIGVAMLDAAPLALVRCEACAQLVRMEAGEGCPSCTLRRREEARARALCAEAGEPLPPSLRGPEAA